MSVDQDATQAFDAEPFDKSHATHVRREIINLRGALTNAIAIFLLAAIKAKILGLWHAQVPLANWFLIYRSDSCKTFVMKIFRQISTNKATRTGYDD
jgi:hypothetical protein